MTSSPIPLRGLWLPLITPFRDGALDAASLRRLVRHYADRPLDGLVLAGTTGEALALSWAETELVARTVAAAQPDAVVRPCLLGLSGSDTRKLVEAVQASASWPVDGYLVCCPSYMRPSQEGLIQHFEAVAQATDRPVVIYNIPYRTGVNLANDSLLRLAEVPNVVGVKDCAADPVQSADLLRRRPAGFSVMTGEDAGYFGALCQGADGAILASAHIETDRFAEVGRLIAVGEIGAARTLWRGLSETVSLLFSEPSPAALKHWLWRAGLIARPDLRLPMTGPSAALAARVDAALAGDTLQTPP